MNCQNPNKSCENSGRYLASDGLYLCGLCSIGKVAVRVIDLPEFIRWTHELMRIADHISPQDYAVEKIREMLPREK